MTSSPADAISRILAGLVLAVAGLGGVALAATEGGGASASAPAPAPGPGGPSGSSSGPGPATTGAPQPQPRDCIEQIEPDFPFPAGTRRGSITTDARAKKAFGGTVRSDLEPVRAFYDRELAARGIRWAPLASDSPVGTGSWFGALDSSEVQFGCYLQLSDNDASRRGPAGTVQISVELR